MGRVLDEPAGRPVLFVSHASEDSAIARSVCDALAAVGVAYWLDLDHLPEGKPMADIQSALNSATHLLVVATERYFQKVHARDELEAWLSAKGGIDVFVLIVPPCESSDVSARYPSTGRRRHLRWDADPAPVARSLRDELVGQPSRIRVSMVASEYPPNVQGGLGVHVHELGRELGALVDLELVVPTLAGPDRYSRVAGVALRPTSGSLSPSYVDRESWLDFSLRAARSIEASDPQPALVHCHDWVSVLAGVRARWTLGVPLVFHVHLPNTDPFCASIENLGLACADVVTVNSSFAASEVVNRSRVSLRSKPIVIPNGVDASSFAFTSEEASVEGRIVFVGRLVEQKGIPSLLKSLRYVRQVISSAHLVVVGSGAQEDALRQLVRGLDLQDVVHWRGWLNGSELASVYRSAACVAVPSVYEPFGMTALEAMATGRVVVASQVGGLVEVIEHGVTGFLTAPRDDLELAQWVITVLSDADLRARIGGAARVAAQQPTHSWQAIAGRFAQMYRQMSTVVPDRLVTAEIEEAVHRVREALEEFRPIARSESRECLDELLAWATT